MGPSEGQHYKVKLASGRILGPLDLERVRTLILKNHIVGREMARLYPQGDWQDINLIPDLAELLMAKAQGKLEDLKVVERVRPVSNTAPTKVLAAPTQALPQADAKEPAKDPATSTGLLPGAGGAIPIELPTLPEIQTISRTEKLTGVSLQTMPSSGSSENAALEQGERTQMGFYHEEDPPTEMERTRVGLEPEPASVNPDDPESEYSIPMHEPVRRDISNEKTVVFQRSVPNKKMPGRSRPGISEKFKSIVVAVALGMAGYELFFALPDASRVPVRPPPIRPVLPSYVEGRSDPATSQKIYTEAMGFYVADTVPGYKMAATKLLQSASLDITNVKALAMLASCYLQLIDSSNKDENYFSVISKLIDMSRAKSLELPETVIADVEFFVTANKAEAAQNRIVEYSKTHQDYDPVMFYYLAYAFYARGDAQSAAQYIGQYPENRAFSARVFYLRGLIAEKLQDFDQALGEYKKAIKKNKDHARSYLRMAALMGRRGHLKEAAPYIEFLLANPTLLAPRDLAQSYFLHAQLNGLFERWDLALGDVERAVRLDRDNHDYLLELYSLRARAGDKSPETKAQGRMYYFLGEGERYLKQGMYQEALTQFLQARQSNMESPLPPTKIGDMFVYLNDISSARHNYQLATQRAPGSIEIWSKYIETLIQSFEWEEAQKAMGKFRSLAGTASAIDKLAGDIYAKQGQYQEALALYKKAMGRDVIDPKVYIAYAKTLMAVKNHKDAPFFFALALRFDPMNVEALTGTAKAIAAGESIDRAISMLQDELQKSPSFKAEILAAIAEFQIQQNELQAAQDNLDLAKQANPDYAMPWRLQAQIHMAREHQDKKALDKALESYKSYSDRNPSDPSGYLDRYKIFLRKTEFEKANEELDRIYAIYPKYPNLHYYKGVLYGMMANHKVAVEEFKKELINNPGSVTSMLALGKEYIELNAPKEALDLFNKAMQLAPTAPEPKHMSGYANFLLKNYHGAVALYNAALTFDKANPMIYKRLGMAYHAMGDMTGARTAFKKYLEMEPDAPDRAQFQRFL
jgi:tetratricopeptide (TPR) repeat protein